MTARGADYARKKHDNYPTPIPVVKSLLKSLPKHFGRIGPVILDPCCGPKRNILKAFDGVGGYLLRGTDIQTGHDFFTHYKQPLGRETTILTNPPYGDRRGSLAVAFIEHALKLTEKHKGRVIMLLPVDFDSGKTRRHLFADHPAFAGKIVLTERIRWFKNKSGSTNHAWYLWDWRHKGLPTLTYAKEIEW